MPASVGRMIMNFFVRKLALAALVTTASGLAFAADDSWQGQVGEALGKAGAAAPGGIYRAGLPRGGLKGTLAGARPEPAFAVAALSACRKIVVTERGVG